MMEVELAVYVVDFGSGSRVGGSVALSGGSSSNSAPNTPTKRATASGGSGAAGSGPSPTQQQALLMQNQTNLLKHPERVYVHPAVMSRMNIGIGSWVSISNNNKTRETEETSNGGGSDNASLDAVFGKAWPATGLATKYCMMHKSFLKTLKITHGSIVRIVAQTPRIIQATTMEIACYFEEELQNIELYNIQLREIMRKLDAILVGQIFYLSFRGLVWEHSLLSVNNLSNKASRLNNGVAYSFDPIRTNIIWVKVDGSGEQGTINVNNNNPKKTPKEISKSIEIRGLDTQMKILRDLFTYALQQYQTEVTSSRSSNNFFRPSTGVLLYGPPGTGKTLLARNIASYLGCNIVSINGSDTISKYYGDTEQNLRNLFYEAKKLAPCIIFIDELDTLCPKRDEASSDFERRTVATFLILMDEVVSWQKPVFIIGATNRLQSIDPNLRRPGRFDREIEIPIPNTTDRLEILRLHLPTCHTLTDQDIGTISSKCHGFVGADISSLCKEASIRAVDRYLSSPNNSNAMNSDSMEVDSLSDNAVDITVTLKDFQDALRVVRPSVMREIMIEVPKVLWSDIGGQEHTKQQLKEAVEWPLKYPGAFQRMGIKPPKGILLYGPPGCSKTMTAKALATEAGLNFIAVKGPELFNKWVGESEKAIREVFRKARAASPSVIFFDEIDAIGVRRGGSGGSSTDSVSDRVLSQLLSELDGIEPLINVMVLAATNRPDILDKALLRPGRFDRLLYVAPPDEIARKEILLSNLKKMPVEGDVSLLIEYLVNKLNGYSGAEIVSICREAALIAIEENQEAEKLETTHFELAIQHIQPRITKEMIKFYEDFRATH